MIVAPFANDALGSQPETDRRTYIGVDMHLHCPHRRSQAGGVAAAHAENTTAESHQRRLQPFRGNRGRLSTWYSSAA